MVTDYRLKIRFVLKLGRALHECGASSERIERHVSNVTTMLGIQGSFFCSPTFLTFAFWEQDELDQSIHIERVKPANYNLGRLWEIDRLVESMEAGRVNFAEGLEQLGVLSHSPLDYPCLVRGLAWFLSGGSFSLLLSANPLDALVAGFLSLTLFLIDRATSDRAGWEPLTTILGAFATGLGAGVISRLGIEINAAFVILSSIILMIPGLSLAVALTEISGGHLISGSSRLVDAVMTLLKLFFGTLSGVALAGFFPVNEALLSLPALPSWRIFPAVMSLSIAIGISFNSPWSKMPLGLLAAVIAFGTTKLGEAHFSIYAGMFLGALAVGLFANLFARLTRGPASILIIHGIILLVPGSRVYAILNHWVSGEEMLPAESGGRAIMAFVALIAGLLFSNAILPARKSL